MDGLKNLLMIYTSGIMGKINEITQDFVTSLFEYVDGDLYWKVPKSRINIGDKAGCITEGYRRVYVDKHLLGVHRIIWLYHRGYFPKMLDHKDRNKLNNRIENLREVTPSQNIVNRTISKSNLSSIFKGVSINLNNGMFRARIDFNKKRICLGHYKSEKLAALAYNEAAKYLYNEYAYINEISLTIDLLSVMANKEIDNWNRMIIKLKNARHGI